MLTKRFLQQLLFDTPFGPMIVVIAAPVKFLASKQTVKLPLKRVVGVFRLLGFITSKKITLATILAIDKPYSRK